jgi:hypothetical protein
VIRGGGGVPLRGRERPRCGRRNLPVAMDATGRFRLSK